MQLPGSLGVATILVAATARLCLAGGDMTDDDRAILTEDGTPGDPEYGAYLVEECSSCHAVEGSDGVPPITGIEPAYFRLAMDEYVNGERDNAAMKSVALSLGDEEQAALAAYFATLQEQD